MPYDQAASAVADMISETVACKPEALIALPSGRTPSALYEELVRRYEDGRLSLSSVRLVLIAEFESTGPERGICLADSLKARLIDKTDVKLKNCIFPSIENIDRLDDIIASSGGIDLAVLGLGREGQIAYNEPTAQFSIVALLFCPATPPTYFWAVTFPLFPQHFNEVPLKYPTIPPAFSPDASISPVLTQE